MLSQDAPTEIVEQRQADAHGRAAPPSADDPLVGRVLESKYELISRLGEGNMGAVYRARRIHIGDEVAVKILHQRYVTQEAALERFRREAHAAARLHHPNVVAIYDYGEADSKGAPAFIVMELVAGSSLRDILAREGKLDPARAVALMRDICAGVGAAHRNDIIHRDVKPDNIIILPEGMIGDSETAKVVDFGIAKLRDMASADTLTQTGMVIGTPYYMSPEQCRAEKLDARSDVYSLGAMLYEMLIGRPPFIAATATGVVAKHLTELPRPFPPGSGIPPALEAACMRALEKKPEARQADARMLARELQQAVGQGARSTAAPPLATTEKMHSAQPELPATRQVVAATSARPSYETAGEILRPARASRPGLIAAVVVAAIALVIAAGAAIWIWSGARNEGANRNLAARPPAQTNAAGNVNASQATASANENRNVGAGLATTGNANLPAADPAAEARQSAEARVVKGLPLSRADLEPLSPPDLRLLRNTVFARHGRIFDSDELQRYFNSRPWYRPIRGYADTYLTPNDRANLDLIKVVEGGSGSARSSDAEQVIQAINGWVQALRAHDLEAHLGYYADNLDTYYKRSNVDIGFVRGDRARAFDRFSKLDVRLSNINVEVSDTGAKALVTFDKSWNFEGDRPFSGSVRQMIELTKIGDRWRITGERDIQ